jgi:hypothetical protein
MKEWELLHLTLHYLRLQWNWRGITLSLCERGRLLVLHSLLIVDLTVVWQPT